MFFVKIEGILAGIFANVDHFSQDVVDNANVGIDRIIHSIGCGG